VTHSLEKLKNKIQKQKLSKNLNSVEFWKMMRPIFDDDDETWQWRSARRRKQQPHPRHTARPFSIPSIAILHIPCSRKATELRQETQGISTMTALLLLSNNETTTGSTSLHRHHHEASSLAASNGKTSAHDDDKEYDDDESTRYMNVFFRYMDGKVRPSSCTELILECAAVLERQMHVLLFSL
jgi:hypothetical protein